jgi:hypothetical protein
MPGRLLLVSDDGGPGGGGGGGPPLMLANGPGAATSGLLPATRLENSAVLDRGEIGEMVGSMLLLSRAGGSVFRRFVGRAAKDPG